MASLELGMPNISKLRNQTRELILNNKVLVTSMLLLAFGSFAVIRVNRLTMTAVDEGHLKQELSNVESVTFNQSAITQIKSLNDTNIEITSEFTNRNNPFITE